MTWEGDILEKKYKDQSVRVVIGEQKYIIEFLIPLNLHVLQP
jgi:hypothetical protein